MSRRRLASALVVVFALVASAVPSAFAEPFGTFRWRFAPYCNVVTVDAVRQATSFTLSGKDDQCGESVAAAVSGTAHLNPNGTIGLSLLVTRPDGLTLSSTINLDMVTLSGVWKDDAGNEGMFLFNPLGASGDPRRITVKGVYSAGFLATQADAFVVSDFSFGRTLPAAPAAPNVNIIPMNGVPTVNCPGSFANPRALPGQLCLYERFRLNVVAYTVTDSTGEANVADTIGAFLTVATAGVGSTAVTGAWAVTIP